ncbi:putative pectinesterase 53, partial [Zea mays]
GRHGGHGRVLGQAHGHVRLRHVRRQLHVLRRQEHHLQEHGPCAAARRSGQAGGGAADIGGQRGVRGVQLPGRAGHAVRPPRPPLLPRLLHRGLRRLHLRQRALPLRGVPCARDRAELRRADGAEPAEPAGGHGVLVRQVPGDGVRRAVPGPRLGNLLPRRLRLHLHGQHHHPARLVQLGRPDAGDDGVLRAVQVHGAGRELRRQGAVVAGAHRRGGQALHLARLHRRLPVAPVVARHIVDTHTHTHHA